MSEASTRHVKSVAAPHSKRNESCSRMEEKERIGTRSVRQEMSNSQSTYTSRTSDRSNPHADTHILGSRIIIRCEFVVWQFLSTTVE